MKGAERFLLAVVVVAMVIVLAFYAGRVFMPLPLYAWDEESFAIRALFPDHIAARNYADAAHSNGVFLVIIQAVHAITDNYVQWLRVVNLAAYFGGIAAVFCAIRSSLVPARRLVWLCAAAAFPYYRFAVSDLPEGCYVGVLGVLAWVTTRYYRRALLHASLAGVLAAVLVLIKPHGISVVAALLATMALSEVMDRSMRRLLRRVAVFGVVFFAAGNAMQWVTGQAVANPLAFFVEGHYNTSLTLRTVPGAFQVAALSLGAMISTALLFAGLPLAIGVLDIARRWRQDAEAFRLQPNDVLFVLLGLSLIATVCMVAIFAFKMAINPAEHNLLWGRYFEFLVPMIWLASAAYVEHWDSTKQIRGRLTGAAIVLAGMVGLLLSCRAGILLLPWNATAVTAFFARDEARAAFLEIVPFRLLAVTATLVAVACIAWGFRTLSLWVPYVVVLACLSTLFDWTSMESTVQARMDLADDLRAAVPLLAKRPGETIALVDDGNTANLVFVEFSGRPEVLPWKDTNITPERLAKFRHAIVAPARELPVDRWERVFQGKRLSIFDRKSGTSE